MAKDFVVRAQASRASAGQSASARVNQAEMIVGMPWVQQAILEGRGFVAGTGLEEAGVDGAAAVDETTPSWALTAPASGTLIYPLFFRAYFDTEGGAAPTLHVNYVQANKAAHGAGTLMTALNLLGGWNSGLSAARTAQGKFENTLSSLTSYTAAENVVITERTHVLDNYTSVEAATTIAGAESPGNTGSSHELIWQPEQAFPIFLNAGSALMFYAATGTTDSKYNATAAWLELDPDVYVA